MAYNKNNLLLKMVEIQNITLEHTKRGVKQEWVYTNVIWPQYRVSRGTYYRYLAYPAKAELRQCNERKQKKGGNQTKLF